MKIHIPEFKAMAKCNEHLNHEAFDIEISEEAIEAAGYKKIKPTSQMTNADYIRAMSDEELARQLVYYDCEYDSYFGDFYEENRFFKREEAEKYELEWLKRPYKEHE